MRLPLPFLLYVVAVGLFGWAAWTCYETLPMWQKSYRDDASQSGIKTSYKLLAQGQVNVPVVADWRYDNSTWWQGFKRVNLVGKLPEKPKTPAEIEAEQPKAPPVDMRPLEEIIELVSLVSDGQTAGKGGNSHVIVRYKPEANVEPPEWWIRENSPPGAGTAAGAYQPPDRVGAAAMRNGRGGGRPTPTGPPKPTPTTTAMPTSTTGREILQKLWLEPTDDPRLGAHLWPPFAHIRIVRVKSNAQAAYFVRELPPPAGEPGTAPEPGTEPAPAPAEEELWKTLADIPQDVLAALDKLNGTESVRRPAGNGPEQAAREWREVEETTRFGNEFHIGRKDEMRFRESADTFFDKVYVDTWVGNKMRGVQVRSVETQLAGRFGVATGDVLLEINGRAIESKAQAVNMVKKDYQRGVRTYSTKWLSNGQIVERVYQAPNK